MISIQLANARGMLPAGYHLEPASPSQNSSVKSPLTNASFTFPHTAVTSHSRICGLSSILCGLYSQRQKTAFIAPEIVGLNSIRIFGLYIFP